MSDGIKDRRGTSRRQNVSPDDLTLSADAVAAALETARARKTYPPAETVRNVERDPDRHKDWPVWQGTFWDLLWRSLESRWRIVRGQWEPPEDARTVRKQREQKDYQSPYPRQQDFVGGGER